MFSWPLQLFFHHVQVWYVLPHGQFCFNILSYFQINSNSGGVLSILEPVHEPKLNICHLHGLGATYTEHVILLIPTCKWLPIDQKLYMTFQMQHILKHLLLEFLVEHVLVGINPCVVVAPSPQIHKLLKTSQDNGFKICELIRVGMLPLFWRRVAFCRLELIWVEVW